MKKTTCLIALAFLAINQLNAQTWIDVTDSYIVNPRFDNNDYTTGWSGTKFGGPTAKDNAEHYDKNFDTYQVISGLSVGKYRVSVQAYYRAGDATSDWNHFTSADSLDYKYARLYAESQINDDEIGICYASSAALEQSLGGGTSGVDPENGGGGGWWGGWGTTYRKVIPNSMEAGYYWFEAGYYWNSIDVIVGPDGELKIGVRKSTHIGSDWLCLDNWKLEFYGSIVKIKTMQFDSNELEINMDETRQLNVTVTPSNATYKKFEWTSSNEDVVTVDKDGNIYGAGTGEAVITATSIDGSDVSVSCTVKVINNGGSAESMIINEIMTDNIDMFVDPSWNYGGWVELYNPTDKSANIGKYWISDDPNKLKKAKLPMKIGSIPAHGFFTLWFDHADTRKDVKEKWLNTQVNMSLDCDGGTIYISDDQGNLITSQEYPPAIMRASYARTTDGGDEWRWTSTPTPTESNEGSEFADEQLPEPEVDKKGQLFEGSLQVCVNIPEGTSLFYTTDGNAPTLDNGIESLDGLFTVDETTTYRFRLFKDGYLPSNVVTCSYIYKDRNYYLPVVSVVTNPDNIYDNTIGIYVSGTNGKTANCDGTKRNFNMEWDRPVNFEYMVDEQTVLSQEVNMSICGGWSRKYEPRSFKLKAAKEYGLNELPYQFFANRPYNKNKVVQMRNGGNDEYNQTRIKDVSLQEIARLSGFKLNLQSVQPTHVFFNGKHIAMLNMREPSNKHFGYANYGIDTDEIDAFEVCVDSGYVQQDGTREMFNRWYTLSERAADPMVYSQIGDIVDIEDYINYMAFKFFLNDWDWPHNNAKGFRDRNNGKFKFVIFDLDNCVDRSGNNIFNDFQGKKTYTFYSRPEYDNTSLTKEVELVTIFLNMLDNADFKKQFIDTYCIVGGCVFRDEDEIADIVNEIASERQQALSWENHNPFNGTGRSFAQGIINAVTGNFKSNMIKMLKDYSKFNLSNTERQQLALKSNISEAEITYNGLEVPKAKFDGYSFAPVVLKAQAPAGYQFKGWKAEDADPGEEVIPLFGFEDDWSFYQDGSLDNVDWMAEDYDEAGWQTSAAPFGYGNSGKPMANATTKVYKEKNGQRVPTIYFRKEFTLDEEPADDDKFRLTYQLDDGAIIYVNGEAAGLYHMQYGASYSTTSEDYVGNWYEGDNPYNGTLEIDKSLLHQGTNVIAVEVHNCNNTSSDLWWDGTLELTRPIKQEEEGVYYLSKDEEFELPESGNYKLVAVYEKLSDEELAASGVVPVKINEVSASNSIYVNEYYKKNDWIELYNTTDKPVDVAGMYLSDNIDKPLKYQIPASEDVNTVIEPFGHLVIWCDKLDPISQLHTSFKLAAEGGYVLLTAEEGEWADTLQYCAHDGICSVGLFPDGSNNVYAMNIPTIGERNRIHMDDTVHIELLPEQKPIEDAINTLIAHNGDMSIGFDGQNIFVNSDENKTCTLVVYTAAGQATKNETMRLSNGQAESYVGNLPAGVYIARAKNSEGEVCSCKFVIK